MRHQQLVKPSRIPPPSLGLSKLARETSVRLRPLSSGECMLTEEDLLPGNPALPNAFADFPFVPVHLSGVYMS